MTISSDLSDPQVQKALKCGAIAGALLFIIALWIIVIVNIVKSATSTNPAISKPAILVVDNEIPQFQLITRSSNADSLIAIESLDKIIWPKSRIQVGLVALDNLILLIGGRRVGAGEDSTDVTIYDTQSGNWSNGPSLSTPRYRPLTFLYKSRNQHRMIIACGCQRTNTTCSHTCETLDVNDIDNISNWTMFDVPTSICMQEAAAVMYKDEIYFAGGLCANQQTAFHKLDPISAIMVMLPDLPNARELGSMVYYKKNLVLCGGYNNTHRIIRSCDQFSLTSSTWNRLDSLPEPGRTKLQLAVLEAEGASSDDLLLAIGGFSEERVFLDDIEVFDGTNWTRSEIGLIRPAADHSVLDIKTDLFAGQHAS